MLSSLQYARKRVRMRGRFCMRVPRVYVCVGGGVRACVHACVRACVRAVEGLIEYS